LYPKLDDLIKEDVYLQKIMKKEKKTDKEKEGIAKRIQKLARGSEKLLKNETNTIIQEEAVTGCMDVLKSYMDIDVTETENVLKQFARVKEENDTDMVQKKGKDIVLDIKGDINGKRLNIQYNLTDGTLWEDEFLSR
jgi:CRISPR/Cas system-associated exonuclease Cas4 (RecB family)